VSSTQVTLACNDGHSVLMSLDQTGLPLGADGQPPVTISAHMSNAVEWSDWNGQNGATQPEAFAEAVLQHVHGDVVSARVKSQEGRRPSGPPAALDAAPTGARCVT